MPRAKRQPVTPPEATADEPVSEVVVEAAPIPGVPEVKPQPAFGEDPDDLYGSDVEPTAPASAPAVIGNAVTVVYSGLKVTGKGVLPNPGPIAVTITVPPDREPDYDVMITEGVTYTMRRGQAMAVLADDAEWLFNHPAFAIQKVDQ